MSALTEPEERTGFVPAQGASLSCMFNHGQHDHHSMAGWAFNLKRKARESMSPLHQGGIDAEGSGVTGLGTRQLQCLGFGAHFRETAFEFGPL